MFDVFPTARLRPSPFFHAIKAEGCTSASIYNRMILPASFGDPDKMGTTGHFNTHPTDRWNECRSF